MKESLQKFVNPLKEYWTSRSKKQRIILISAVVSILMAAGVITFLTTRTNLVPLYSNLTPSETGSIKESLDGRGIESEITDGGQTIKVPEEIVDTLKVELAAEGLPKSGSIDYSFFSQNAGMGTTENEFNVLKLDAMQTELANLIKGIEGITDAKVMINLPETSLFVTDQVGEASASIVLSTKPGYQFEQNQITALYQLVSKSVPNLPTDNIVIMNQNFEYFDLKNENNLSGSIFANHQEVKKEIERDVQRQVQSMLGTLMGQDKVVVSVTADIDFTQENREENLVTPVDEENMEGLAISAQKITEAYTGSGNAPEGVPQAEEAGDTGYTQPDGAANSGNYEKVNDTINYEINRIRKEIVESPFKIRDLGIQVMVEPPEADNPDSLPAERVDDMRNMLATIVRTSIDKNENAELTDEDINRKISVSVQPFKGKIAFDEEAKFSIPWWIYAIGGVLVAVIGLLVFLYIRARRKSSEEDEESMEDFIHPIEIPDVNDHSNETENSLRRKQLEKMAKEKPEEFAKLLRSWIAED
ncbi:flagellar basal-body MS-ring/collar protein FliF [Niallia endozanthoxylica]|uniref:Flagellar M-ring protein n=1 Tax=Niallia endozanthoxylica TaxID=2036016 RepID=A0A5J5HTM2_9BACI|nr:flagellar basal-body MS-ring/collar protein FliF [Niallia endozanthoxylica]KAA9025879.1 flagellar basal body M-ring protein FliF [Niallia endozanthoxylica]